MLILNFPRDPNTRRFNPQHKIRNHRTVKCPACPKFCESPEATPKIEQRQAQNVPPADQESTWSSTSTGCSSPSISDMSGESDVTLSVQRPNPPQISPNLEKYANFANKAKNLNKIYKKLDNQEHKIHNHIQEIYKLKNPSFWSSLFGNNEAKIADEEGQISNLELEKQLFSNIASILECANNQSELEEALGIYSEFINEIEQRQREIDPNQTKLSNLRSCKNKVIKDAIKRNDETEKRAAELYEALTKTMVELVNVEHRLGRGMDGTTYKASIKCLNRAREAIRKCINKDKDGRLVANPYDEIIPYQILQTHALKQVYSTIRGAYEFACMHHIPICFSAPPMPEPISSQNVQAMRKVHVDEKASYLMGKDYSRDIFSQFVSGKPLGTFICDDEHGIVAKFSLEKRLEICRQYLEAIKFMNDAGLIHHDLHTGNVMLDNSGAAHVIDLGRAIYLKDLNLLASNASVDTLSVTPPESLKNSELNLKSKTYRDTFDVYSLGLMFFSIIYGKPGEDEINTFLLDDTYKPRTDPESRTKLFENIETIVDKCTANCPREQLALQQLSGDIKTLLQGMLNPNPENRYNAEQAENFVSEMISGTNS